jgi:hypothetical protein
LAYQRGFTFSLVLKTLSMGRSHVSTSSAVSSANSTSLDTLFLPPVAERCTILLSSSAHFGLKFKASHHLPWHFRAAPSVEFVVQADSVSPTDNREV